MQNSTFYVCRVLNAPMTTMKQRWEAPTAPCSPLDDSILTSLVRRMIGSWRIVSPWTNGMGRVTSLSSFVILDGLDFSILEIINGTNMDMNETFLLEETTSAYRKVYMC